MEEQIDDINNIDVMKDRDGVPIVNPTTRGMIQNPSEFIQKLLENSHIPRHLVSKYWALTGQTIKLTFLTQDEVDMMMLRWDILKVTIIESVPKIAFDEDMEFDLEQMEIEFNANLNRSKGSRQNERELISTTTNATYAEASLNPQKQESGWASKVFRALKGGK